MSELAYYVKPNIKFEPLVAQWYAWPHLVSPATAALNLKRRYLDILRSYLKAPAVHAAAVKNPALMGGPFMDLPVEHLGKARALLERTETQQAGLLALADALVAAHAMLRARAKGGSLEGFYKDVPEPLRGFVELVYDLANSPSLRLIEALLYASGNYDKSIHSIMLSPMETDYRPFIMSTPRFVLDPANEFEWNVAFDDPRIDAFAGLRNEPLPVQDIQRELGIPASASETLQRFLTTTPPVRDADRKYMEEGVRIRYFGHACLLIETREVTLLVDPFLSYQYPAEVDRFSFMDLPDRIDYVLFTHGHADHVSFEWLLQLRSRIGCVVFADNDGGMLPDPSLRLMLNAVGFRTTFGLQELNTLALPGGHITAIPFLGEHGDLNIRGKTAYMVELKGQRMLIAADLCNADPTLYEGIRRVLGPADLLFLGMECDGAPFSWVYGPCMLEGIARQLDQDRKLNGSNFERAWSFVRIFECKEVYTYAMGMEPWLGHIMALVYTPDSPQIVESNKLIAACKAASILAERPFGKREWLLAAKS